MPTEAPVISAVGRRLAGRSGMFSGHACYAGASIAASHVEEEVRDVAVLHDVALSLGAELAGGLDGGFGLILLQIGEGIDLGADETALKIGVDDSRSLWRGGADRDFPGANLLGAGGEEG